MKTINADQHRTESVDVRGIEIVPDLSVAVYGSTAVDVNIVASKLEERCHVLEDKFERVSLPVHRVVGKLNIRLDI